MARILEEGGRIIGKTTCEDLCLSGASYMTTLGPVRNPNNPEHSAGGSSSGSGVVVSVEVCHTSQTQSRWVLYFLGSLSWCYYSMTHTL